MESIIGLGLPLRPRALFNFAPAGPGRKCCTLSLRSSPKFYRSKKQSVGLCCTRDGSGFDVRARAGVGRADGQAEFDTGVGAGADENGRRAWSGEQDKKKAAALGDATIYPIMRVYRDDLCSLEVTGDAKAWQVVEAMAADGGFTAAEELSKGRSLMTVETIIPGRWQDHSTVSTKLLAPTHMVNKTAKIMWAHKKVGMSSGNALARAFQKVVMQHLLSFDIHVRSPGTARDMANLANEKEGAVVASLESRDAKVLEGLAEAICAYSITNIKDNYFQKMSGESTYDRKFSFGRKPEWIWALSKAIGVRSLSESEILEHAKRIFDESNAVRETKRTHQAWWPPSVSSLPSSIHQEQGQNSWSTEFIPTHKLQIDTSKFKVVAKGWQTTETEQVLEVDLTHAQLVDLADMLDLYYEDAYSTPAKTLQSGVELRESHLSQSKVTKIIWTAVLSSIAGGVLLVGLLVVARLKSSVSTDLPSSTSSMVSSSSRSDSSFTNKWCRVRTDRLPRLPKNEDIQAEEMEVLCLQVVNRVKDAFNLVGQVESSPERGAWIGADLSLWGRKQTSAEIKVGEDDLLDQTQGEANNQLPIVEDLNSESAPDTLGGKPLLLYQVVLSRNGKVLGFQPGNKPAIGRWVDFPFAKELHKYSMLRSGIFERGLKYSELSEEVVAIELLCNTDSKPPVITARPLKV